VTILAVEVICRSSSGRV